MSTRVLTVTGKAPRKVITPLSDREALEAIAKRTDSFARDLLRHAKHNNLTDNRLAWVHILALEAVGQPVPPVPPTQLDATGLARVQALFNVAKLHLKKPRLRLQTPDGLNVVIAAAPATGKNAGYLYVKGDDDAYYGKISPLGEWHEKSATESLRALLLEFASAPAETAQKYGRLTGKCCFCALPLSDVRSTEVGYGETCAKSWDQPWGTAKTKLAEAIGGSVVAPTPKKRQRKVQENNTPLLTGMEAAFAEIDQCLSKLHV